MTRPTWIRHDWPEGADWLTQGRRLTRTGGDKKKKKKEKWKSYENVPQGNMTKHETKRNVIKTTTGTGTTNCHKGFVGTAHCR